MAGKPKNMSTIRQVLQQHEHGLGIKTIARNLSLSKNTVKNYLTKYSSSKLSIGTLLKMDDYCLEQVFHPGNPAYKDMRFEQIKDELDRYVQELKKTGVTKKLLWEEYRFSNPTGYSYSQFNFHLQQYLQQKHPSMVLEHIAGEKLYVDFAGKKLSYVDIETGEIIDCQVFVACLPYSDYSFCIALRSQSIQDFIFALNQCLIAFGGAPKVLVPDNLKSAIIKSSKYEPTINQVLEDFANHYNISVVPARVRKPKDKALVENQVKLIYNRVYARMRNQTFFSLHDLNQAIKTNITLHNQTRMQLKDYCREEHFLSHEKSHLQALPQELFEIKYYREYRLANNNHIFLGEDKHYYSAPYQYIGKKLKVIYTRSMVYIFYNYQQIAVHTRSYNKGQYSTIKEHLCSTHQYYLNRSPDFYIEKAQKISEDFGTLTTLIFEQNRYPEQLYRTCEGLLRLYKNSHIEDFNKACKLAVQYQNLRYSFMVNILQNKTMYLEIEPIQQKLPEHANIRGKEYYNNQLTLNL